MLKKRKSLIALGIVIIIMALAIAACRGLIESQAEPVAEPAAEPVVAVLDTYTEPEEPATEAVEPRTDIISIEPGTGGTADEKTAEGTNATAGDLSEAATDGNQIRAESSLEADAAGDGETSLTDPYPEDAPEMQQPQPEPPPASSSEAPPAAPPTPPASSTPPPAPPPAPSQPSGSDFFANLPPGSTTNDIGSGNYDMSNVDADAWR
jgi:hypothetical protein